MYMALGIGHGDEVIVPSMTFVSSATSILHAGATPVFADVDPVTFNLDAGDVVRRVTRRTKAILTVHYGGQPGNLDELASVARDAGVWLLEDAAQAHGSAFNGRPVGGFGKAAMFSFTPTKNITTGEGGIVTTRDALLAERIRLLRNHGQTAPYEHSSLGFNWRMTEMQAAIGEVQVRKLDALLARKRRNAKWVAERLRGIPGLTLPTVLPNREHTYMLYTLLLDRNRDEVLAYLRQSGIEARLYFPPAHQQPIFGDSLERLPVTEQLATQMLSIPFHSLLSETELEEICQTLCRAVAVSGSNRSSDAPAPQI
jgi:perosamine synthetase